MTTRKIALAFATSGLVAFSVSCKKKDSTPAASSTSSTNTPSYSIPTNYNAFTNVDYTESAYIIGMTSELSTEINKGAGTSGSATVPLSISHLMGLLRNQGSQFTSNALYNTSGYQIEANCIPMSQPQLESYLDSLVAVSNAGQAGMLASSGVAGLGITLDAVPKRYLLTANGYNYAQIVNKGLMCDLVLYQIVNRVLQTSELDNATLNAYGSVQATEAEHNWDVAFKYFGVPDSFPAVKTPVKLWGSYSNQVDAGLGCNAIVMNAFLKGRAAIHNKDIATAQAQANIIATEFDIMTAGAVGQELNEIKTAYNAHDYVKVCSTLSECRGFVMSMFNNKTAARKITDYQIQHLLSLFPVNHWNMSSQDLANIGQYIADIYGFSSSQMAIL